MSRYTSARNAVRIPPCDVAAAIRTVNDPALVADIVGLLPTPRIVGALEAIGVPVSTPAMLAHRLGDCACTDTSTGAGLLLTGRT